VARPTPPSAQAPAEQTPPKAETPKQASSPQVQKPRTERKPPPQADAEGGDEQEPLELVLPEIPALEEELEG
jgi:hypothetical protein